MMRTSSFDGHVYTKEEVLSMIFFWCETLHYDKKKLKFKQIYPQKIFVDVGAQFFNKIWENNLV